MSAELINIVLDLETLGTDEDSAIIQIGAVVLRSDWAYMPLGTISNFEATIAYEHCLAMVGEKVFTMSDETMQWWERQPTREKVFSGQDSYMDALSGFVGWCASIRDAANGAKLAVWGNGSDFDNRLLAYTLSALGYVVPWNFRDNRDLRTLKALAPPSQDFSYTFPQSMYPKHTALGDALYEAALIRNIQKTNPWVKI